MSRDFVKLEAVDGKAFDRFTSIEVTNDLTAPAEASFECGDNGTWKELGSYLKLGAPFRVIVNGRPRLTGRLESKDGPLDAANGATVRVLVRTKLSDAAYASCRPDIAIQGATLKQVILKAYESLGFTAKDFVFQTNLSRDLMTGRPSKGKQSSSAKPETIKIEEARVQPPETIYEFVERHLLRFRLTHWDSPDGRIVVGAPNDEQSPIYWFVCKRPPAHLRNNIVSARRVIDASDSPSVIGVFGGYQATEFQKSKVGRKIEVPEIAEANLYRPVFFVDPHITTREQAEARARKEIVNRIRRLDSWEIRVPGWAIPVDANTSVPYGIDTVADVDIEDVGGSTGAYLVHRVHLVENTRDAQYTELTCCKKGLWRL